MENPHNKSQLLHSDDIGGKEKREGGSYSKSHWRFEENPSFLQEKNS